MRQLTRRLDCIGIMSASFLPSHHHHDPHAPAATRRLARRLTPSPLCHDSTLYATLKPGRPGDACPARRRGRRRVRNRGCRWQRRTCRGQILPVRSSPFMLFVVLTQFRHSLSPRRDHRRSGGTRPLADAPRGGIKVSFCCCEFKSMLTPIPSNFSHPRRRNTQ